MLSTGKKGAKVHSFFVNELETIFDPYWQRLETVANNSIDLKDYNDG